MWLVKVLIQCGKVKKTKYLIIVMLCVSTIDSIIPYDGVPRKEILTVHPALTAIFIIVGSVGILFAIACLIFNIICRNAKLAGRASLATHAEILVLF